MCHIDRDDDILQFFIVVDRRILLEVESESFSRALFILMCVHYAFNIDYKTTQKLFYVFLEEFCMGFIPKKKSKEYRSVVTEVFMQ